MPAPNGGSSLVTAAVWAAGAWAAWNGAVFAWSGTLRHRAESAWFIFAVVLLAAAGLAALGRDHSTPHDPGAPAPPRSLAAAALGFIVLSLILYGRAFGVGLLSDDFVLLDRAERLSLLDPAWSYLRPLPLLAWWMASWSDNGVALHAINILLHGVNAWLVYRIALGARLDQRGAAWAGVVFLSWPTHVEAVAWASGVFDVMMTSFVLLSVLNVQDGTRRSIVRIARGVALAIAAMACKETAVALPILLVTVWPLLPPPATRSLVPVIAAVGAIVLSYAAARLILGVTLPGASSPSGYELKELVSRPFGAMALNLHEDAASRLRVLPVAIAIGWPALLAWTAAAWRRDTRTLWLMLAGASWLMVSVLPLLTSFFVGPDLQQSRYLYLGATVWSIALVAIAVLRVSPARRSLVTIALALVVIINGALVVAQQSRWLQAASVREQVQRSFVAQSIDCDPRLAKPPDNIAGAYIFRNGFAEAIARSQPGTREWRPCVARWDGARFVVE